MCGLPFIIAKHGEDMVAVWPCGLYTWNSEPHVEVGPISSCRPTLEKAFADAAAKIAGRRK